ncbi:hypothetical protein V1523DRAFT_423426 [Lipomyces doorenjongii]
MIGDVHVPLPAGLSLIRKRERSDEYWARTASRRGIKTTDAPLSVMSPASAMDSNISLLPTSATVMRIPIYDGKNFIVWGARVKSTLASMNALTAIEEDVEVSSMTAKQLQSDSIAKGLIIGLTSPTL